MSRVITFSRVFPSYHPRAGEPTYFVEKVWNSIAYDLNIYAEQFPIPYKELGIDFSKIKDTDQKHHTIRAGHQWKVGDKFSPRVWSDKPYRSKQITFAPDIEIKKVWDFDAHGTDFFLSGKHEMTHSEGFDFSEVEKNDGLEPGELFDWICLSPDYKKSNSFTGQILCWNENINY
jgi:hypothetical protein